MDCIENGIYRTNDSTATIQKISNEFRPLGEKFLKRILIHSFCTKYNEIRLCHLDVQKHISYAESHKILLIFYELFLETAETHF